MRIALAQLNYHIGNFDGNLQLMRNAIVKAKSLKADLICFSELSTCGYPPVDFLEFRDFIHRSMNVIHELAKESFGIGIAVGSPTVNPERAGKDLFNSAFFLSEGKVVHIAHKGLLPNYDIFDEYRYFEPAKEFSVFEFKGKKIAITICEDIWNVDNVNPMYDICPMDQMINEKPDFMLNLSASPFCFEHTQDRLDTIRNNALRYKIPIFYCNCYGSQTDIVFDGGSVVVTNNGIIHDEMPYFEECIRCYDLNEINNTQNNIEQVKIKEDLIYRALILGVRDYFKKMNFKSAILGLSGGIDSAITAVIASDALGPENVTGILMPSHYSSEGSVADAKALAENLGIHYEIIPIKDIFNSYESTLKPWFKELPANVTEENIQARIRGMLLMAFSNKFNHILLNTTNKSEMAVGYGTLYGDLCGGLAVLADVYKTEIYKLAAYINRDHIRIPQSSIEKPPSAELRPGQKDSDSLPEYSILDPILYQYIEKRKGPNEIIAHGHNQDLVLRILKMVNKAEFKRYQSPPVIRVSYKAFGSGRRLPIEGNYLY
ncbi:MAG: NAD+ synthase [Saprospiraceae bacterium]|nr:NAD+ synthase [Saprospiraceae bacterium]